MELRELTTELIGLHYFFKHALLHDCVNNFVSKLITCVREGGLEENIDYSRGPTNRTVFVDRRQFLESGIRNQRSFTGEYCFLRSLKRYTIKILRYRRNRSLLAGHVLTTLSGRSNVVGVYFKAYLLRGPL